MLKDIFINPKTKYMKNFIRQKTKRNENLNFYRIYFNDKWPEM